jgi:hypothetical protein
MRGRGEGWEISLLENIFNVRNDEKIHGKQSFILSLIFSSSISGRE